MYDTQREREREREREEEEEEKDTCLDAMFETVELPAGVANLNSSLANVDRDALSHGS